jgi:hypothetical protein
MQRFRDCTYKKHTLKCKRNVSSSIRLLPQRTKDTARFFLLVRDPRDVVISMWYYKCSKNRVLLEKNGRMERGGKGWKQAYSECSQFNSLSEPNAKQYVIKHLNETLDWYLDFHLGAQHSLRHYLTIYYEDFMLEPEAQLQQLVRFLGYQSAEDGAEEGQIAEAVRFAAFDSFREIERGDDKGGESKGGDDKRGSHTTKGLLEVLHTTKYKRKTFIPGNSNDITSFHARNGSSGQWRWEFSAELKTLAEMRIRARMEVAGRSGKQLLGRYLGQIAAD